MIKRGDGGRILGAGERGGDTSAGEQTSVGRLLDVTVRFTHGFCPTAV